jgi:PST family polysaccharide transporter
MAGLFVLREPFVHVVLGDQWTAVIGIITWLAPVGFLQSITSTTGAVFMTFGRTDVLFKLGIFSSIVHVSGFIIGAQWGVNGVAAAYFVTNVITAIPTLVLVMRMLQARPQQLLAAVQRPIGMASLMTAVLYLTRSEVMGLSMPMFAQLGILVLCGAVLYFVLAHFAAGALERDILRLITRKA